MNINRVLQLMRFSYFRNLPNSCLARSFELDIEHFWSDLSSKSILRERKTTILRKLAKEKLADDNTTRD